VTAVDVSQTALARGAAQAVALSVTERVRFEQHDLTRLFPAGTYDLVSAQFLQSPIEFPRDRILRAAAGAVAPGGHLLVVAHAAFPPGAPEPRPAIRLPTPDDDLEMLALDLEHWHVERRDIIKRNGFGPSGEPATFIDGVLVVQRLSAASEHRA
jgi:SAM-dependent methyltransferase